MNAPSKATLLLALATSSCFIESSSSPSRSRGSLLVDWTINGQRDPDQCDQGNAETIAINVFRADGAELAEYQDSCRAFATQIDLPPGAYSAEAVLLDPAGFERTTVVNLQSFEIFSGEELDIPIDFPASSFR
jgi:hypothetical protein